MHLSPIKGNRRATGFKAHCFMEMKNNTLLVGLCWKATTYDAPTAALWWLGGRVGIYVCNPWGVCRLCGRWAILTWPPLQRRQSVLFHYTPDTRADTVLLGGLVDLSVWKTQSAAFCSSSCCLLVTRSDPGTSAHRRGCFPSELWVQRRKTAEENEAKPLASEGLWIFRLPLSVVLKRLCGCAGMLFSNTNTRHRCQRGRMAGES